MAAKLHEEDAHGDSLVGVWWSQVGRGGGAHGDSSTPWRCYAPLTLGPHTDSANHWLTASCQCPSSLPQPNKKQ